MTKKEILKSFDIQDDDKVYVIRERRNKDKEYSVSLQRVNIDFTAMELMGYLERIQIEILMQVSGQIKPTVFEGKVGVSKKHKEL
jgi:hypothetical protein